MSYPNHERLKKYSPPDNYGSFRLVHPEEVSVVSLHDERLAPEIIRELLDSKVDREGLLLVYIPSDCLLRKLFGQESDDLVYSLASLGDFDLEEDSSGC